MQDKHIDFFYHFSPFIFPRENREELIKQANKLVADAIGITPQKVVFIQKQSEIPEFMSKKARGGYDFAKNTIYINYYEYQNPYLLLATVVHETTHILLSILMQRNFSSENINEITYEQYAFATAGVENHEMFERFKKFVSFLNITEKYLNVLRLDKIYYGNKSQPYFYNVDSSEVIAEYISYILLNEVVSNINRTKEGLLLMHEAVDFLDYSYQGNKELKEIYVEENATDKSIRKSIEKIKLYPIYGHNMFKMDSYDINTYEEIWDRMSKEYNKLEKSVTKELEAWHFG